MPEIIYRMSCVSYRRECFDKVLLGNCNFFQSRIALLQDEISTVGHEVDALKVLLTHCSYKFQCLWLLISSA